MSKKKMSVKELELHRKHNETYYNKGLSNNRNLHTPWERKDILMVLDKAMSDLELSEKLQRTLPAIEGCRNAYKKINGMIQRKYTGKKNVSKKYFLKPEKKVEPKPVYVFSKMKKDILAEINTEIINKTLHIKYVGRVLVEYGLNNIDNVKTVELMLQKKGIAIVRG
jgi:hypothetical protein